MVVVGLLNVVVVARHVGRQGAAAGGPVDSWVLPVLLALYSVPSVFYLRRWAISAVGTKLWARAPLVQLTGLLLTAVGMVAALIQLSGLVLVRLAHAGVEVSLVPEPHIVTVGQVYGDLLWQALDAVPVINLTGTLGWERPVTDPNWPLGAGGILMRVAVIVYVVATFVFLAPLFSSDLFPRLTGPRDARRSRLRSTASGASGTPKMTTRRVARAMGREHSDQENRSSGSSPDGPP